MLALVHALRWAEVDPRTHVYDATRTRVVAERLANDTRDREALAEALDRAFVAEHGAWAAGWSWAASEPGGGGPVRGWCCPRDSLFRRGERDAQPSIDRVVAAMQEWRVFLETLAATFDVLHVETRGLPIEAGVEHAAARLLPEIVARTDSSDAWYATFSRVVGWYLESRGHDAAYELVARAVSGRFGSWIAPDSTTASEVCAEIGLAAALASEGAPPDVLASWRSVRGKAFVHAPAERRREKVSRDAHERFIREVDHARDPERASRMLAALTACRASAMRGEALTLERMIGWQSLVLGEPARLRDTDAFAKGGRERYGHDAEMHRGFASAIEEANDPRASATVRAARAYLDTCFFHPFADGNARAARLALDHVLTRAGLALHAAEPVFVVARSANDANGAWSLAYVLEHLVGLRAGA